MSSPGIGGVDAGGPADEARAGPATGRPPIRARRWTRSRPRRERRPTGSRAHTRRGRPHGQARAVLRRVTGAPHVTAGAGDLLMADLVNLTDADWTGLTAFGRACHAGSSTIRIADATAYTLRNRIDTGTTLLALEATIPPEVLELTVSELQLREVHAAALVPQIAAYRAAFSPHLQQQFEPGPAARGPEFQGMLDMIALGGHTRYNALLGRVRNLHRFADGMLQQLVRNFADTSRRRPADLVLAHRPRRERVHGLRVPVQRPRGQLAPQRPLPRGPGVAGGDHGGDPQPRRHVRPAGGRRRPPLRADDDRRPRRGARHRARGHGQRARRGRPGPLRQREPGPRQQPAGDGRPARRPDEQHGPHHGAARVRGLPGRLQQHPARHPGRGRGRAHRRQPASGALRRGDGPPHGHARRLHAVRARVRRALGLLVADGRLRPLRDHLPVRPGRVRRQPDLHRDGARAGGRHARGRGGDLHLGRRRGGDPAARRA